MNGINLNFLLIRDPDGPCFGTDRDDEGNPSLFGTVHRNLATEEQAMMAGLAPGQECQGLRASQQALQHLEAFLVTNGHTAISWSHSPMRQPGCSSGEGSPMCAGTS